ncbi:DUF3120 domain-containing protein [Crocosphaera sp. Alani8]|uniref:DUF3120 domain-containing protein n=1 Tax=Crocosphaera sp. Alani8 TaxID=3038952 RepID=UPI00313BF39F
MGQNFFSRQIVKNWLTFLASGFLVSVPVFIEAPLVRFCPEISLIATVGWLWLALYLMKRPQTHLWGDLLFGFSWSWLAGTIYWGWFRWEPLIHLPIESIGIPFALWCIWQKWGQVGNFFYIGSLIGTAITDAYFYIAGLIPHWRQLMQVDPSLATPIFQEALDKVQTPWGMGWAIVLATCLLVIGLWGMQKSDHHWWALGGAVLSTILVDSLFWFAASLA